MIRKIANLWPSLRQVIYTVLAAILGLLVMFGWVSADQQLGILTQAGTLLGAIGFIMAAFYTPGGPKVIGDNTDTPVEYNVTTTTSTPSITIHAPSVEQITSTVGPTIAELRARLEQSLARRSDG
ncbi:hypothetical protein EEB13_05580 [Rhodococcus sp. WS3]|uniref:hypothetical protein n=1 Tax=Rhodococcus sp. WS3 TaxID=2486271 RepID=UPI0011430587|nr:hypothetical protein [Rhodococcus sp. WS3]ROZ49394.1 hypothetical protein EEB13_05580 [Rhodococcus sp. WS3]